MQTVTEKFDNLASAYLAAHRFELEGKCAVVLDECMGTLYPPRTIRGVRVVTFTTADPELHDVFAQAAPIIEETETPPAKVTPLTFVGLSCITGGFIGATLGLLFTMIFFAEISDKMRRLPLRDLFSWENGSQLLHTVTVAGLGVIRSSIGGFTSGALAAPFVGCALLLLKFRNSRTIAKFLLALIALAAAAATMMAGA